MRPEFVVTMGRNGFSQKFLSLGHFPAGQTFLFHLAMFFGQFKEALRQGKAGLHCHTITGEALAKRLNQPIRALVDIHLIRLISVVGSIGNGDIVTIANRETIQGNRRKL